MKNMIRFLILYLIFDTAIQAEFLTKENTPSRKQCVIGYNAPPLIFLQEKDSRSHDISFDLSFLYYYAAEDGLDLANSAAVMTSGGSTGTIISTDNSIGLMQDLTYNPGFKAGIGTCCREWTLNAEYTWIRQTTSTNENAITPEPAVGMGVWVLNNWFSQLSSLGQTISTTNISSQWNLGMDFADLTMGHPFYEGRYLSIVPFFGVRSAWIRQQLDMAITAPSSVVFDVVTSPINSYNNSNSWAVGPRTGFDASWLFSYGLRIEGSAGASLLFTQYTDLTHSEQVASSATSTLSMQLPNINCVRPELDFGIGLGWGTYFKEQDYYIDFSIKYDFLLLSQQNMMRKLVDQMVSGTGAAPGDLYLQGMNIRAAFYF